MHKVGNIYICCYPKEHYQFPVLYVYLNLYGTFCFPYNMKKFLCYDFFYEWDICSIHKVWQKHSFKKCFKYLSIFNFMNVFILLLFVASVTGEFGEENFALLRGNPSVSEWSTAHSADRQVPAYDTFGSRQVLWHDRVSSSGDASCRKCWGKCCAWISYEHICLDFWLINLVEFGSYLKYICLEIDTL